MKKLIVAAVIILFFASIFQCLKSIEQLNTPLSFTHSKKLQIKRKKQGEIPYKNMKNTADILWVNLPSEYNNLTKKEIYDLRKKYVQDSIFAYENYEPSEAVFGAIEDYKPWYGLDYYYCVAYYKGKPELISGPSEESRYINNPSMLVGYNCGGIMPDENHLDICKQKNLDLPRYLQATKTGKTKAIIRAKHLLPKHGQYCSLVGLNARDLGYNYAYVDKAINVKFDNKINITNKIHTFKDFLHTGYSCQIKGGCTNSSPLQNELLFLLDKDKEATIGIKLWAEKPESINTPEDIYYEIDIQKKDKNMGYYRK